ncbi:TraB/GumN family protein [Alteriqipengyuania flavescens]|uniref:TraB/GumN family protein n=1 Tax=Alteriqipengyuania flavescens TaxID=3053610 RepID=UPI0025B502A1|nr:TraB/GumN family protein [Alteriqipengyuania flavescens]WJY18300.1 TraB/GumN family protein [Alteriqipengyuania flavescens]WJY24241.1 TraB/GumN family protein [Alteriqipengyuania flavescens]
MKNLYRKLATGVAVISLCIAPGAMAQENARVEANVAAETPTGPALWSVSDEDTTIYLLGTVHLLRPETEWFRPYIAEALAASDEVVTEVFASEVEAAGPVAMQKAMLPEGTTLRSLMNDEDRAEYEATLNALGVPVETFDPFEPWFVAINLQIAPLMAAGFDPMAGVETQIEARAPAAATRSALETAAFQIDMFDSLPMESQLEYLDYNIDNFAESVTGLDALVGEWIKGDDDGVNTLLVPGLVNETIAKAVLADRNANWAEWIEERLDRPGTVFIAVGAGHLVGGSSVQAQLGSLGLTAERLH